MIIFLPSIDDKHNGFLYLFYVWNKIEREQYNIEINFSQCKELGHNAVAFLGGMVRTKINSGVKVVLRWDTLKTQVKRTLTQNKFFYAFNTNTKITPRISKNCIPYREDAKQDAEAYVKYLKDLWLGRGWVHVSELLRDDIVGKIYEIYINAFDHGDSGVGVISCGYMDKTTRSLKLTLVDFGVGIPYNVRKFKGDDNIKASSALKWAFQRGASTSNDGRGLGLDILKSFIKLNKGLLEIYSHDAYAKISSDDEVFKKTRGFFQGTVVNITLQCDEDESYYCLKSEIKGDHPLFVFEGG